MGPPTEGLLLYAIANSMLQRRKQILEKYSNIDGIVKKCNNMEGQLDIWKLLDDSPLDGHYASYYAQNPSYATANLAQAGCKINESTPDWYVDSGATAHTAPSSTTLNSSVLYHGNEKVSLGNGNVLPISRIGTLSINQNLKLQDVLIVPNIKKKLMSVSKLTNDYSMDFLFSQSFFAIQDSATKAILS
nr:retrovirus-related Pol polyprotein from transposon TNT 1-94 [Tanacetum cinerariifolium]